MSATTPSSRPPLGAVVLAAGRGSRFPNVASKVLVPLGGRALLLRVLDGLAALDPERVVVVVGHAKQEVIGALEGRGVTIVDQGAPRGTGHAVRCARSHFETQPWDLFVLSGDVPLLRPHTLMRLREAKRSSGAKAAMLTSLVEDAAAYGRVLRAADGSVTAIVEAADASPEQLAIREINVGAYLFSSLELFEKLSELRDDNAQGELYLTDVVRALVREGQRVEGVRLEDPLEGQGVNTPAELASLEARLAMLSV